MFRFGLHTFATVCVGMTLKAAPPPAQSKGSSVQQIPQTWEDGAVAALTIPLANPVYSPVQVSSENYYRLPVRPVYKSYPIYAPAKQPPGYIEWLKQQEPEVVFDAKELNTEADWLRAGELVFEAPIRYRALADSF